MDVKRSLRAAGLGISWKTRRWQPSDPKTDRTPIILVWNEWFRNTLSRFYFRWTQEKMNAKIWASHCKPTLKINVLWAALPNMACKPRCQFGFLHSSLPACLLLWFVSPNWQPVCLFGLCLYRSQSIPTWIFFPPLNYLMFSVPYLHLLGKRMYFYGF